MEERFFYISYNGINPNDGKTVIGHLAFSHIGHPSLFYITEVLVPEQSKVPCIDIVMVYFMEFKNHEDFDAFTIGRGLNDELKDFNHN